MMKRQRKKVVLEILEWKKGQDEREMREGFMSSKDFRVFLKRLSGMRRWWRWDSTGGVEVACFTVSARTTSGRGATCTTHHTIKR